MSTAYLKSRHPKTFPYQILHGVLRTLQALGDRTAARSSTMLMLFRRGVFMFLGEYCVISAALAGQYPHTSWRMARSGV